MNNEINLVKDLKPRFYRESCDAVLHYSRELNVARRLLVTQSFAWLSMYGLLIAEKIQFSAMGLWLLTLLASFFTYFVGQIHQHHLQFVLRLITSKVTKLERNEGPWSTLHNQWKNQNRFRSVFVKRPELAPVLAYLAAFAVQFS